MRIISLILIFCTAFQTAVFAQADYKFEADLIIKDSGSNTGKTVFISGEPNIIKITGKKNSSFNKTFQTSEIKNIDYSYSDKPQYAQAIVTGLVLGWLPGLPFLFNKTKKHWLVINDGKEAVLLQLQDSNYRQLLLELSRSGIKVSDSGDRDNKKFFLPRIDPPPGFNEEDACRFDY